ncbi:MAG: 3-phosphoshikimate 1-carboxyvinyltransferase [Solirubrobacterales bacterium]|nr:3-phosphoshikimate 1-carboxyvinyltransferase [Solirubrobacterales bacterium]
MNVVFPPARRLSGELTPPPDKSISHRAALLAAMSDQPVCVRNYLDAADTNSTLGALRSLGVVCEQRPDELLIRGTGIRSPAEPTGTIDVGNAGTLMRLLPGWLAQLPSAVFHLDGDESIRRRPVDRIAHPLELMGARIIARDGRFPPFAVHGAPLRRIEYELPMASAQVKSCVLLAGLSTGAGVAVIEPAPSRDHTERMLLRAGADVRRAGTRVEVGNVDELELDEVVVPGDPSSAAFFLAAAAIVPGSRVVLHDVGVNWTRTGFLRVLARMGAHIEGTLEAPGSLVEVEPVSTLTVEHSELEATEVGADEVPLAIDELPLVALLGCFAEGETVVRGAGELRLKESDRIAGVVDGLAGLGADIEATDDGFAVRGGGGLRGGRIDALGDHRLAMLGAIAGLASREGVEVAGMDAAAVSYPGFRDDLEALVR